MKLCTVVFMLLGACALAYAQHGPLINVLQPQQQVNPQYQEVMVVEPHTRQKRGLLLGGAALAAGALGAGAIGAGILGAGALGAGVLGAGLIGAKAGYLGGRSFGGGYGGGYRGGYYGGGGYGGGYYGGYRSYPAYYIEDEWC